MLEKRSKPEATPEQVDLTIYNYIKDHGKVDGLSEILGISKQAISKRTNKLKLLGLVEKIGYGTWQIKKEVNQILPGTKTIRQGASGFTSSKSDIVRSHAYQWTLKIPRIEKWSKREEFLIKRDIKYKVISPHVLRIMFKGNKIWLSKKSITIYIRKEKSYVAERAEEAYIMAWNDCYELIRGLEGLFGLSFRQNKKYQVKCDKKHHSLIKNALAKAYNEKKIKFYVADKNGVWMIIDDSMHLNELELPRESTNNRECSVVQGFFNGLKEKPFKVEDVHKSKDDISEIKGVLREIVDIQKTESTKMAFYAENIKAHTDSIIKLGKGIDKFSEKIEQLGTPVRKGYDPKVLISKIYKLQDVALFQRQIAAMTETQKEELQLLLAEKFS